ncbi:MAG TPA: hypothetical protein VHU40_09910 [Polyangia bacterium]|jgi:hypothetical protein|nr:hypothetical protein [Polyangia bacterium]
MRTLKPLLIASLVVTALAGTARAQTDTAPAAGPPARPSAAPFNVSAGPFGETGQFAFAMTSDGEFPFRYSKTGGDWNLSFRPALDYFIQQSLSLGAQLRINSNGGGSTIGIGLRVGYNIPLGNVVSLWVRGGLAYDHTSVNNGPSRSVTSLGVEAPFLFHLVPHFLLGVGPFISVPLTDNQAMASKDPSFGLTALVGGYF